jgi:high-affinity iron transporter
MEIAMNHKARTFLFIAVLMSAYAATHVDQSLAQSGREGSPAPSQETHLLPAAPGIEPVWRKAVDGIAVRLKEALDQYKSGKTEQAKKTVTGAQFDRYKNSLLETAVRKSISLRKDFENNARFTEILALMSKGAPETRIQESINALSKSLEEDLPALKLVEGAIPKEVLDEAKRKIPEKDWLKVSEEVSAAVVGAIGMYSKGKKSEALALVKEAYFDDYDESGLEAKIDSANRDANLRLGSHFSKLARQMESGEPPERIERTEAELKSEMKTVVSTLDQDRANGVTSFFSRVSTTVRAWF